MKYTSSWNVKKHNNEGNIFFNNKWLNINVETMYNKITSCSKITEMKNLTKFSYQTKWKWENQVKKPTQSLEEEWDEAFYKEILYYIQ